jgi:PilZ domain-containing protein
MKINMSDENDAGANYLAALRQSGTPHTAGAAPARAPDLHRSGEGQRGQAHPRENQSANTALFSNPVRPEHRKSPRYKCTGSARLQERGSASSTWATFLDISMHGCYVESAAPYAVGTLLDLRLEDNSFRIEAIGEVRVTYPGLGMGISFTRISDEDRERLRELVRSISRPSVILGSRIAMPSVPIMQVNATAVSNPTAALQAMVKFFEGRLVMGREEFLQILRKSP